jgi:hypothetical protein
MSVYPETKKESDDKTDSANDDNGDAAPSTPKRKMRSGGSQPLGTIETPAGRRSARIARRKED